MTLRHDRRSEPARSFAKAKYPSHSERLKMLRALEQKVLWLATWMIHHANHIRPNPDGLKVGGHQASSASVVTLMTALYFDLLRGEDRVAVKPHASPVFHAIQYLLGRQSKENLERFRALGGAQAYPSRTKDADDVDISTGSVGLGAAQAIFSSLVQDYVQTKGWLATDRPIGRKVAIVGDAELDEGNIFEALFEGWKHDLRNVWWVIDYNRQSLDLVVEDHLVGRLQQMFRVADWDVIVLKYGRLLREAFDRPGGEALREWIDNCPNSLYSALVYRGGSAWREQLQRDLGASFSIVQLLETHDDNQLHRLMTNLAGHDLETILDAFHSIDGEKPTAVVAYTIKGYGLPLAGHKDNHAGMLSPGQVDVLRDSLDIPPGREWDPFAGLHIAQERLEAFIAQVPFVQRRQRRLHAPRVSLGAQVAFPRSDKLSTQAAFGRLLNELARHDDPLVNRIVTMSPDVASSTNLGAWVTKRGIFDCRPSPNVFREQRIASSLPWAAAPDGQHFELGITETNLFLLLAACGLAAEHHGERLIPIGTVYDPFISRGLDALNYACYQDARFILVGTPSGVSLSAEGGAHQSIYTPLIGIGQPGLTYFEPTYADELREILLWAFDHVQAEDGGSVYLRLSTRKIAQPRREMTSDLRGAVLAGGYWMIPPTTTTTHAIVAMGAVMPSVIEAQAELSKAGPPPGVFVATSPDRLMRRWIEGRSTTTPAGELPVPPLLNGLPRSITLVAIADAHPLTLGWLGSFSGIRVLPLGVSKFGMSGYLSEVHREHGIDAPAIVHAIRSDSQASQYGI